VHVFVSQQLGKLASAPIPQTHPDEMEKLMDKNQTQRAGPLHELRIDHHFALSNEASRVNRSTAVSLVAEQLAAMSGQWRFKADVNRAASELRQSGETIKQKARSFSVGAEV
jgi:hypothetical protein